MNWDQLQPSQRSCHESHEVTTALTKSLTTGKHHYTHDVPHHHSIHRCKKRSNNNKKRKKTLTKFKNKKHQKCDSTPPCHNRFTALFPGPPSARRELLDFMVQGKINRGRHTDHPTGHRSIRTNQCPPPPFQILLQAGCPFCRPTNSVKAVSCDSC